MSCDRKTGYISAGKAWLNEGEIVGVFDLDITSQSARTREYLRAAEQRGSVINAAEDIPRTFVVCAEQRGFAGTSRKDCDVAENGCGTGENGCGAEENSCGAGENGCGAEKNSCGAGENGCRAGENGCGAGRNGCGEKQPLLTEKVYLSQVSSGTFRSRTEKSGFTNFTGK